MKTISIIAALLVCQCAVAQKPLTIEEFEQVKKAILNAPYWYDLQGNRRTDPKPPPVAGNLIRKEFVAGYWAFRKGIPKNKNPYPWPTRENSTLTPEELRDLQEMAKEEGGSTQEELDWAIRQCSKASSWDNGWHRGQRDEKWRTKKTYSSTPPRRRLLRRR